jgi:hypothetical protein
VLLLLLLLLLQIFDHGLPWKLELLPLQLQTGINSSSSSTNAAAANAGDINHSSSSSSRRDDSSSVRCLKLVVGLTEGLLQGAGGWKRSPAAALLFKLLNPIAADEGGCRDRHLVHLRYCIADVNLSNWYIAAAAAA